MIKVGDIFFMIVKKLDRLGFSKSSSNVVYPISDFVFYHRLSKIRLAFTLQLYSMCISSHFREGLEVLSRSLLW